MSPKINPPDSAMGPAHMPGCAPWCRSRAALSLLSPDSLFVIAHAVAERANAVITNSRKPFGQDGRAWEYAKVSI